MEMDTNTEPDVAENLAPFLLIHHDGRVERLYQTVLLPPSTDSSTGLSSKDVIIDSSTGVSARIYLPPPPSHGQKLPLLLYFHGGGFAIESAASPLYHPYLTALSAQARFLCVSLDYRLAPEHPLPAAYDDSRAALSWVCAKSDPWLANHADFDEVFLAGDSAGANIAHNLAMRAARDAEFSSSGVRLRGLALIHPYFWFDSPKREKSWATEWNERLWRVVYPSSSSAKGLAGEPWMNPSAEGARSMAELCCERVFICIAGEDFLREQGELYLEALKGSGFSRSVELHLSVGEEHIFHLLRPEGERAKEMMKRLVEFLNVSRT